MFAVQKRIMVPVATLAGIGLITATAYLLDLPPFEPQQGTIESSEVCDSLGLSSSAVTALRQVLPPESSYSFQETPGIRVGQNDGSYTSSCFVNGEDKIILSARTQMMLAEPSKDWVESEVLDEMGNGQDLKTFTAGERGVASPRIAAILVPCASTGEIPGGRYNLSVLVKLKESGGTNQKKARKSLIDLALGAAHFSHQKARCDLPAKLPAAL